MLVTRIREIADEPLTLSPEDQEAEFANTVWLSAAPEELRTLSVDQVVVAFAETANDLRRRVGEMGYRGTATFYVWHDEQAGQLRCSVSSRPPANLPFGGNYYPADDLSAIVAGFLSDSAPGRVPWEQLEPAEADEEPGYPQFPVWTCDVSQGA